MKVLWTLRWLGIVTKCILTIITQEAQLPLRNRASAMYCFVTFYRRNDLQLRLITSEAYVR